jgi:hypothetical protein
MDYLWNLTKKRKIIPVSSVLDPDFRLDLDSIRSVDPDPDSESGFGSKKQK